MSNNLVERVEIPITLKVEFQNTWLWK